MPEFLVSIFVHQNSDSVYELQSKQRSGGYGFKSPFPRCFLMYRYFYYR